MVTHVMMVQTVIMCLGIRCPLRCSVVKVLVKDGMKIVPRQPLYIKDKLKTEDIIRLISSCPRPESATRRILELNHCSRVGIFLMEDVLMDQDGADPDSIPLAGLHKQNVRRWYKNFKNFDYVMDHTDHFYSAQDPAMNQMPEDWAGKIHGELRILEEQLPKTIYVICEGL
uniref:uncharacterized protein LOC122607465 n=1 Tax=Erigeron canadensis TaxID=72917 RepID=UPI001CB9C418|nr:uncharacterized protein LOC122607465 [Erigeron canadensis]